MSGLIYLLDSFLNYYTILSQWLDDAYSLSDNSLFAGPISLLLFKETWVSVNSSKDTTVRVAAHILEELLFGPEDEDLVVQAERDDAVQLVDVPVEAVEDVEVRRVFAAPALQRCQLVKVRQSESSVLVCETC